MKKFNELLKDIEKNYNTIKELENKQESLINTRYKRDFSNGLKNAVLTNEQKEHNEKIDAEIIKSENNLLDLKIEQKLLKNNARISLYYEVMPKAVEIINKYTNKPYGEKTKEKISNEIKEVCNCRVYIYTQYTTERLYIYPCNVGNEYNIEISFSYSSGKKFLIDNKIQALDINDTDLYFTSYKYVEDIPQRIEELKATYKKAVAKQKELKEICKEYNSLIVGNMNCLSETKNIYDRFDI